MANSLLSMNKNPKVDAWFETYDNPQKEAMMRVREIILNTDEFLNTLI